MPNPRSNVRVQALAKSFNSPVNLPFIKPEQPVTLGPLNSRGMFGLGTPAKNIGNRFAFPLPTTAKGPIRARETRKQKGLPDY